MVDTKKKILTQALKLFSTYGYEAVSVNDIATELKLTKSALYKHFLSKRDVFTSILKEMERLDAENASKFYLPLEDADVNKDGYSDFSIENLKAFCKYQFSFWTENVFASSFRKMLTIERYTSREMGKLYSQYLESGPLKYVTDLFEGIKIKNAKLKALEFYSPMFFLYGLYDSEVDKQKIYDLFNKHIENFKI